jgi:hypothetical protein
MDSAKVTNSPGMDELRRARTGDPQGGTPAYEGDGAVKRRGVDARHRPEPSAVDRQSRPHGVESGLESASTAKESTSRSASEESLGNLPATCVGLEAGK